MSFTDMIGDVLARARSEGAAIKADTLAIALSMLAMLDGAESASGFGADNRAQMGGGIVQSVITVVIVGVVGIVGILIFSEVNAAIDVTGNLSDSASALESGFGSAMELLPIVLIVIVASLVIAVIGRFR